MESQRLDNSAAGATTWNPDYSTTKDWRGTHGRKMMSNIDLNPGDNYVLLGGTSLASDENGFNVFLVGNMFNGAHRVAITARTRSSGRE